MEELRAENELLQKELEALRFRSTEKPEFSHDTIERFDIIIFRENYAISCKSNYNEGALSCSYDAYRFDANGIYLAVKQPSMEDKYMVNSFGHPKPIIKDDDGVFWRLGPKIGIMEDGKVKLFHSDLAFCSVFVKRWEEDDE